MRVSSISIVTFAAALSAGAACGRVESAGSTAGQPTGAGAQPSAGRASAAAPAVREVTIPAGTNLPIVIDTPVGSDTSRVEETVRGHLAHAIEVHGETALPSGSAVTGVVTEAVRSGKVKGRARLGVHFTELSPRGGDERYDISTRQVARVADATKKKDALEIGAPAAGGALIGALVGGKKGALIGTAVGGGAGTGVVLATKGKEVHLPKGSALGLKLAAPVTVKLRG